MIIMAEHIVQKPILPRRSSYSAIPFILGIAK